ncbi:MAG: response regulator [Desulfobulbaceae bacterium]|nr:response regulator [Desulfobulbaceae bacterium]
MFRSIKTKILLSQIGLVLITCGLLGISSYILMVDSLMKTEQKHLENIARNQAEKLGSFIQHKEEKFKSLSMSESIEAYSMEYHEPVLIQHFNSFMDEFPMLAYVRQDGLEEMKLVNGHERPERLVDISNTFLFEEATWELNKVITLFPSSGRNRAEMARRSVISSKILNFNTIVEEYLKSPEHKNLLQVHPLVTYDIQLEENLLDICGSPIHLSKMVMNLIYNAAEAMHDGGIIKITSSNIYVDKPVHGYDKVEEGEYVTFTVTDPGVGISEDDLGKIFEPFYTKKEMGKSGTGLGMSVVWGTVKDHNGYIQVQSTLAKGTMISIYLPVTRQQIISDDIKLSITDYQGKGESILVVDDIAEQREIAYQMLTQLGYAVNTAASGEEAVAYFQENKVDLLILDMIMEPGMDGLETYKRVMRLQPGQKAIIISGFFETRRVQEAEKLGVGSYVLKPYDLEKIGLAVKTELYRCP